MEKRENEKKNSIKTHKKEKLKLNNVVKAFHVSGHTTSGRDGGRNPRRKINLSFFVLATCSGFCLFILFFCVFISVDFVAVIDSGLGNIKKSRRLRRERKEVEE